MIHDFEPGWDTYVERQLEGYGLESNIAFDKVKVKDYDAILILGGRAPEYLRNDKKLLKIVREFNKADKWLFSICHGIQVLVAAGLTKGKRLTCYEHVKFEAESVSGRGTWDSQTGRPRRENGHWADLAIPSGLLSVGDGVPAVGTVEQVGSLADPSENETQIPLDPAGARLTPATPHDEYQIRATRWRQEVTREDQLYGRPLRRPPFRRHRRRRAGLSRLSDPSSSRHLPGSSLRRLLSSGLMIAHLRIDKRRQFARRAVRYYEQGLKRLDDDWSNSGDTPGNSAGDRFADPNHPYASDLDIFGRGSLFELISTARTYEGEATLATWLKYPATHDEAAIRQQSVRELAPNVDQRGDPHAAG